MDEGGEDVGGCNSHGRINFEGTGMGINEGQLNPLWQIKVGLKEWKQSEVLNVAINIEFTARCAVVVYRYIPRSSPPIYIFESVSIADSYAFA